MNLIVSDYINNPRKFFSTARKENMGGKNSDKSTISITNALWGGGKAIGHPEVKDRMFGVADYKLKGKEKVNLKLSCLSNKPTYEGIDSQNIIELAESMGWVKETGRSGIKIYHLTLDEITALAESVKD